MPFHLIVFGCQPWGDVKREKMQGWLATLAEYLENKHCALCMQIATLLHFISAPALLASFKLDPCQGFGIMECQAGNILQKCISIIFSSNITPWFSDFLMRFFDEDILLGIKSILSGSVQLFHDYTAFCRFSDTDSYVINIYCLPTVTIISCHNNNVKQPQITVIIVSGISWMTAM